MERERKSLIILKPKKIMTAEASSVAEMQVGAQRKRQIWRIITRNKATLLGLVLVLSIIAFATVGSLVSPYSPNKINPAEKLALPGEEHFLGTDQFGRDILSRLISGARVSLLVGVLSVALATVVGVTLGALTGFFGGWLDEGIMRGVDILMSFPYIILAIALAAALGPGFGNVILILSVIRIPVFARVSRAAVMAVTQQEYVLAATGIGQTRLNILFRHVLPNSLTAVIVVASLSVATAINAEAAISFLGLGIRPPQASWGNMLADAQLYILTAPWLGIAPGLLISLTVLGFNLLGDGLRDILDPRMRTS